MPKGELNFEEGKIIDTTSGGEWVANKDRVFEFIKIEDLEKRENVCSKIFNAAPYQEENILKFLKENSEKPLSEQWLLGKTELIEVEKSQEELSMIEDVISKMDEFIKKYKGSPVHLKQEQVHFLDSEKETKRKEAGFYAPQVQFIGIMREKNSLSENTHRVIHEVLHFQSFQTLQISDKKGRAIPRRLGLEIISDKTGKDYFTFINEAITEILTEKFEEAFLNSPIQIQKRKERRQNDKDKGIVMGYEGEVRIFKEILEEIYNRNQDRFLSTEDVFNVFAESYMTGELLEIARIFKKTYGKKSFRKIGEIK